MPFISETRLFLSRSKISGPSCVGGQHKDLTVVWLENVLCMLFLQAYLTENKHVLAFLVRYPVDRLFIVSCHVHFIQVFSETKKVCVSNLFCDNSTLLALRYVICDLQIMHMPLNQISHKLNSKHGSLFIH